MKQKKLTITIAVPTYEANDHLVETLKSIYRQTSYSQVKEVLVLTDGKKLSPKIARQIRNSKLKIIEYKVRQGQSARINDAIRYSRSDLIILTNDDVVWRKNALVSTLKTFAKTRADLICNRISSSLAQNTFNQQ
jgi:glycosyltransferase involved in cell wall biosynthesis